MSRRHNACDNSAVGWIIAGCICGTIASGGWIFHWLILIPAAFIGLMVLDLFTGGKD